MVCPNCGTIITNTDLIDTEWYDNNYYDNMIGTCENCNKTYTWSEVFIYSHDVDVQEVNREETIHD